MTWIPAVGHQSFIPERHSMSGVSRKSKGKERQRIMSKVNDSGMYFTSIRSLDDHVEGDLVNVVDGLFAIADAISELDRTIRIISVGDKNGPGVVELIAMNLGEIAKGINAAGDGIAGNLELVADALDAGKYESHDCK